MLEALDDIPREFREVVLLCDVQEFTYKEIAEMLSVPVGTVMSRLARGRATLAKELLPERLASDEQSRSVK